MEGVCNECGEDCNEVCSRCQFVYYCSKECQKKQWLHHKVICFKEKHQRIAAYIQHKTNLKQRKINLSKRTSIQSTFPLSRKNCITDACLMCSRHATFQYGFLPTNYEIQHGDIWIKGWRCIPCWKSDLRYCSTTWKERTECLLSGSLFPYIIHSLGKFLFYDIVQQIVSIIKLLRRDCLCTNVYKNITLFEERGEKFSFII